MIYSIDDEFSVFKSELSKLSIKVISIHKVGSDSMSFHEVFYKSPKQSIFNNQIKKND